MPSAPGSRTIRSASTALANGYSLVEVMISLLLGMIIIASIGQLYVGARQSYRLTNAMSEINENGRFALEFLANDLRMAGYLSCGGERAQVANAVDSSAWYAQDVGLRGYDDAADNSQFQLDFPDSPPREIRPSPIDETDAFFIRRADPGSGTAIYSHQIAASVRRFYFKSALSGDDPPFSTGEIVVATDDGCQQAAIFQVSLASILAINSNYTYIEHNTGGDFPGNCTSLLSGDFSCPSTAAASAQRFPDTSSVARLTAHAYYVTDDNGTPTLMMQNLAFNDAGQVVTTALPLIRDVESMQILYGVDSTLSTDYIDSYVTASAVTDWAHVFSIRIALLLRTKEDNIRSADGPTAFMLSETGVAISPPDRRIRKVFTTNIALRNILP